MTPAFWQKLGSAASIDWCEPNYQHSHFVAEWWNTLSSVVLIGLGAAGLWHARRVAGRVENRFVVLFMALALVGFGSTAFHATLLRSAQALDELPMIYSALAATYALKFRASSLHDAGVRRRWQLGLLSFALVFSVLYFTLQSYFVLFILSYTLLLVAVNLATIRFALYEAGTFTRRLCLWAVCCHGLCFFGLWVPEHLLLPCSHPLQVLELHALYHLGAGLGSYAWMLGLVLDRRGRQRMVTPSAGAAVAS